MPRLLIVNADDFGLSCGVNDGIIEAHLRGVVTSTSLMVNRPGAEHAANLAREHPSLSVGLHVDHDNSGDGLRQASPRFATQLAAFRELMEDDPTHVDSHHHFHADAELMPVFSRLVAPLGVPLRHDGRVRHRGGFWGQSEDGVADPSRISVESLLEMIRSEVGEGFTEIGCHPARLTGDFRSSYLKERAVELKTLTAPRLREEIEAIGVELVSYRDWSLRSQAA
jgi:predicted glycoside hydrolase/deacetylase ChbG (UPF0249 family)